MMRWVVLLVLVVVGAPSMAAPGDVLWVANGGGTALAAVAQGRRTFTAGHDGNDWLVRAYDVASGAVVWEDRRAGWDCGGCDKAVTIAVEKSRVFAAGRIEVTAGNFDWLVRAYDGATGAILWEDQFDAAGDNDKLSALAVQNGRVHVTGFISNEDGGCQDWLVRTYDAATGTILWDSELDHAGCDSEGLTVAVQNDRVFAAGLSINGLGNVRAYNAEDGTVLWRKQFDGGFGNGDQSVALTVADNRVFVTGTSANEQWAVRAFDGATGTLLWGDQLGPIAVFSDDNANAVPVTVQGNRVFMSYTVAGESSRDWIVRAYETGTGALLWESRFDDAGEDVEVRSIVTNVKRVYVAAIDVNPSEGVVFLGLVRAFNIATGALEWDSRSGDPEGDVEARVLVALRQRVIQAGSSVRAYRR